VGHLKDGLFTYLTIAERTSNLLENQSISLNALSSQIISLNDLVEQSISSLNVGFGKLHATLRDTEGWILSWVGGSHGWMAAGCGGFILGTFAGVSRWIILGTSV
jgi:hypothetical protein